MSFKQELSSWFVPKGTEVASVPAIGSKAPQSSRLNFQEGQAAVIVFLRHCGCPFAEKTFLNLRESAKSHSNITFIAISHSDQAATETWLKSLPQAGSEPRNLRVIVDDEVEIYAAWGLGPSNYAHVLSPSSLYEVWRLGSKEGIWNRPTESGSRWQTAGFFAVDGEGVVRWGRAADRADEIPEIEQAVAALQRELKADARLQGWQRENFTSVTSSSRDHVFGRDHMPNTDNTKVFLSCLSIPLYVSLFPSLDVQMSSHGYARHHHLPSSSSFLSSSKSLR